MRTRRAWPLLAIGLALGLGPLGNATATAQHYGRSTRRASGSATAPRVRQSLAPVANNVRLAPRRAAQSSSRDTAWGEFASTRGLAGASELDGLSTAPEPAAPSRSAYTGRTTSSYFPQRVSIPPQANRSTCHPSRASLLVTRQPVRGPYREAPAPVRQVESWGNR